MKNRNLIKKLESCEENIIEDGAGVGAEITRYFFVLYSNGEVSSLLLKR